MIYILKATSEPRPLKIEIAISSMAKEHWHSHFWRTRANPCSLGFHDTIMSGYDCPHKTWIRSRPSCNFLRQLWFRGNAAIPSCGANNGLRCCRDHPKLSYSLWTRKMVLATCLHLSYLPLWPRLFRADITQFSRTDQHCHFHVVIITRMFDIRTKG